MPNNSFSQYRQSQISSNAPEKTVLMLYDGAIRFLRSAMREISENNNIVEKANFIDKTIKILEYLQSCLDSEKGGEIAENLNKLYDYMYIRLTKANLKNDTEIMNEVLNLLLTVRDGWNGICDNNVAKQHPAAYSENGAKKDTDIAAKSIPDRKVGIKV